MIYFDNASATKVDEEVLTRFITENKIHFANSSAKHFLGQELTNNLTKIEKDILNSLSLDPKEYEIIYCSSATEANNLAIFGISSFYKNRGKHLITSLIEHPSILNSFKKLEEEGFKVTYLKPNKDGLIDINELKNSITDETILVSIMGVNNETGNILNIDQISALLKNYPKIFFHSDLAQTLGKTPFNYNLCDLFTISSYKIYGLKGIGALIKKRKINLNPILSGGKQQKGLRSGSLDYPSISAFALTIEKAIKNLEYNSKHVFELYNYLINELTKFDSIKVHLYQNMSPYIINFSLLKNKASIFIEALSNEGIYLSTKSSCSDKLEEVSHVVYALTDSKNEAKNSIRLSLSKDNTIEECQKFIEIMTRLLKTLRG